MQGVEKTHTEELHFISCLAATVSVIGCNYRYKKAIFKERPTIPGHGCRSIPPSTRDARLTDPHQTPITVIKPPRCQKLLITFLFTSIPGPPSVTGKGCRETDRVVARAGASGGFASMAPDGTGLTAVVQVLIVEQLLCVHADSSAHVKTQFLLKQLPLPGQSLLWVYLSCRQT